MTARLDHARGDRLDALASVYGVERRVPPSGFLAELMRIAGGVYRIGREPRSPRTALPLLGPWAPPVPSGGWLLRLPGGRSRFVATDRALRELCADDPTWRGARRVEVSS